MNCSECGKETEVWRGRPRLTCSQECGKKRISNRTKKIYWKNRPKPIPCKRCGKNINRQGRKVQFAHKYCSVICYHKNEYYRNLFKRHFDKQLRLIKMGLLVRRNN